MSTYLSPHVIQLYSRGMNRRRNSCDGEVGHTSEGTWGHAGAGILIVTDDLERILLLKRSPGVSDPHLWGIPGGACKEHRGDIEDALKTAISETAEELRDLPPGRIRESPYRYQCPGKHFTFTTYIMETPSHVPDTYVPCLNWEHSRFHWFRFEEALRHPLLHNGVREVLENYDF